VLIVTQCSSRKSDVELFPNAPVVDLPSKLPETGRILLEGRRRFLRGLSGLPVTALSLYDGHEYRAMDRRLVYEALLRGSAELLILSGGYGLVHPLERVKGYDVRMDSRLAAAWIELGLHRALEEFIELARVQEVYGLFTKSSAYSRLFRAVNWGRLGSAGLRRAAVISPTGCGSPTKSLRALGLTVNYLVARVRLPSQRELGCLLVAEDLL